MPPPYSFLLFPRHGWAPQQSEGPVGRTVLAGCSVLSLCSRHITKSFTIDIVGDIKSMQAESSSGEEKAKPVTQEDIGNLPRSHPAEKMI